MKLMTLENQILVLKSENLKIIDEDYAKRCLLFNNYYNVINFFGKFLKKNENEYIDESEFNEIMAIYIFDREFKKILFYNAQIVENSFRSTVAYCFSLKATDDSYNYYDLNYYNPNKTVDKERLCNDISKILDIGKNKKRSDISYYYYQKNDVPIYVLVNYMTFGQIIRMYNILRIDIKNEINRKINLLINTNKKIKNTRISNNEISVILDNIKNIRNIVAHNNILTNYSSRNNYPFIKEVFGKFNKNKNDTRRSVFYSFIIMKLFLYEKQYNTMINSMINNIETLNKQLHSISVNDVISNYGFPEDWIALNDN